MVVFEQEAVGRLVEMGDDGPRTNSTISEMEWRYASIWQDIGSKSLPSAENRCLASDRQLVEETVEESFGVDDSVS